MTVKLLVRMLVPYTDMHTTTLVPAGNIAPDAGWQVTVEPGVASGVGKLTTVEFWPTAAIATTLEAALRYRQAVGGELELNA